MLFTSSQPVSSAMANAILRSARAVDAFADVQIDSAGHQIEFSGSLTPKQATAALKAAGCDAVEEEGHVPGGSNCCGGCS